jgi:RNA polymerase sigma factor (sigma-70 family)
MAGKSLSKVLAHIRRVAAVHAYRDLADGDLLHRFVKESDDSAFTVLIERYAPMVLGLCRRMLGNLHDAEDVCQATFLVLARKAASIRKNVALSSWLHQVACRAAGRIVRDRARRQCRERRSPAPIATDPANEVSWREAQTILDEELERLPQRYRAPLILCLDGKTRDETARRLRLSPGTLHARLQRGRELLRERLTRRGLTFSGALFAAVLSDSAARAAVAPTLVITTAKAALASAANQPLAQGVISTSVLALTREALKTMFVAKLKLGTAAALVCLAVGVVCISWTANGVAQEFFPRAQALVQNPEPKAPSPQGESDEAFIRRISRDLRGTEPTPTEVHFFLATKDADKRQKLIDLMIQERQAKKQGIFLEQEVGDVVNVAPLKRGTVDQPPYRIKQLDTLYVKVEGTPPEEPIKGMYYVGLRGLLPLGHTYGSVLVVGQTIEEATRRIEDHLKKSLAHPKVSIIPRVAVEDLHKFSDTEVVSTLYQCRTLIAEAVAQDVIQRMNSHFTEVVALSRKNELVLQDTAGNLKKAVKFLDELEAKEAPANKTEIYSHKCVYISARVAEAIMREVVSKAETGRNPVSASRLASGTRTNVTSDIRTNAVFVTGPSDVIAQAKAVMTQIDVVAGPFAKTYTIEEGTGPDLLKTLARIHKGILISTTGHNQVTIIASPEDQVLIGRIISLDERSAATLVDAVRRILREQQTKKGN